MIGMQQLWDEFERNRLSRETKRGMREVSEQGYRAGGRAPYGYRRRLHELPDGHRGDRDKSRVTLEPEQEEAAVVAEIFEMFVGGETPKAIAEHLNRPGGPPSPNHVDSARNIRGHWAASTIRAMLKNPVYTERIAELRGEKEALDDALAGIGAEREEAEDEQLTGQLDHLPERRAAARRRRRVSVQTFVEDPVVVSPGPPCEPANLPIARSPPCSWPADRRLLRPRGIATRSGAG